MVCCLFLSLIFVRNYEVCDARDDAQRTTADQILTNIFKYVSKPKKQEAMTALTKINCIKVSAVAELLLLFQFSEIKKPRLTRLYGYSFFTSTILPRSALYISS